MYRSGLGPFNPDELLGVGRPGVTRRAMARFDDYFRCYPMVMAPGSERPELNYGSKIIMPQSTLQKLSQMHVQWPLTMELINGGDRHTHAGVLEFVAEEGRVYLPPWMMQTLVLDLGDMIQIKSSSLAPAKLVKLQPQSVKFLDISDPKAVLEKAFRNFATLTQGDVFNFAYNDEIYDVAVLEVKPESEKMGVSMIETDVSVDFAPPLGYEEPQRQKGSGTSTPGSSKGGLPVGGVVHSHGSMAQAINYDAIAPNATAAAAGARAVSSHFISEGHKLNARKGAKAPIAQPSTPVATTSSHTVPAPRRTTNGPLPLRLPPNKLFLGYEIKPVKTDADKKAEQDAADNKPCFAGRGKTLRGGPANQEGDKEEKAETPPKTKKPDDGRRLDGRTS